MVKTILPLVFYHRYTSNVEELYLGTNLNRFYRLTNWCYLNVNIGYHGNVKRSQFIRFLSLEVKKNLQCLTGKRNIFTICFLKICHPASDFYVTGVTAFQMVWLSTPCLSCRNWFYLGNKLPVEVLNSVSFLFLLTFKLWEINKRNLEYAIANFYVKMS